MSKLELFHADFPVCAVSCKTTPELPSHKGEVENSQLFFIVPKLLRHSLARSSLKHPNSHKNECCVFFRYFDSSSPRFCRLSEAPTLLASVRSLSLDMFTFFPFCCRRRWKNCCWCRLVALAAACLLGCDVTEAPLALSRRAQFGGWWGKLKRGEKAANTTCVCQHRMVKMLPNNSLSRSCEFRSLVSLLRLQIFLISNEHRELFLHSRKETKKKNIHIFWLCALLLHFSWRFVVQRVRRTENSLSRRRVRVSEKEKSNREYLKREIIQEKKTKSPGKINSRKNSIFSWTPSRRHTLTAF